MAKDTSKISTDGKGNTAVYDKDGVLSQLMVDGKVWNVGVPKQDRDAIRNRK